MYPMFINAALLKGAPPVFRKGTNELLRIKAVAIEQQFLLVLHLLVCSARMILKANICCWRIQMIFLRNAGKWMFLSLNGIMRATFHQALHFCGVQLPFVNSGCIWATSSKVRFSKIKGTLVPVMRETNCTSWILITTLSTISSLVLNSPRQLRMGMPCYKLIPTVWWL